MNADLYLQYIQSRTPLASYFGIGAGYYLFTDTLASSWGYAVEAGFLYGLGGDLFLDGNIQVHNVMGSLDIDYIQLFAGIVYRF